MHAVCARRRADRRGPRAPGAGPAGSGQEIRTGCAGCGDRRGAAGQRAVGAAVAAGPAGRGRGRAGLSRAGCPVPAGRAAAGGAGPGAGGRGQVQPDPLERERIDREHIKTCRVDRDVLTVPLRRLLAGRRNSPVAGAATGARTKATGAPLASNPATFAPSTEVTVIAAPSIVSRVPTAQRRPGAVMPPPADAPHDRLLVDRAREIGQCVSDPQQVHQHGTRQHRFARQRSTR